MFALGRSAPHFQAIISARAYAHTLWTMIDTKKHVDRELPSSKLRPTEINGNIAFVNVGFAYPTRSTIPVLQNLSFSISAGQTVALVGATGSGKVDKLDDSFICCYFGS